MDWNIVGKKHKLFGSNKQNNYVPEKCKKKILCKNVLRLGHCTYGDKCMYAHNLEDQNVDFIKQKAYSIIKNDGPFNINLSLDNKLANIFLQLTKVCPDCKNNVCPGGYNCKHGSVSEKYCVCYNDLMNGNCNNADCKLVHLTKKGVLPINYKNENVKKINTKKFELRTNSKPYIGTLLDDNFFTNCCIKKSEDEDYDSDNESVESIEKIKNYLEEYDSDKDCEKSIFTITNQQSTSQ